MNLKIAIVWEQVDAGGFDSVIACLLDFASHTHKTPVESIEDIEILRFLEMGYKVRMVTLSGSSIAVDTQEDLERVTAVIKSIDNYK